MDKAELSTTLTLSYMYATIAYATIIMAHYELMTLWELIDLVLRFILDQTIQGEERNI